MNWTRSFSLLGFTASVKVWAIVGAAVLAVALSIFAVGTATGYNWASGKVAKVESRVAKEKLAQEKALGVINEANRAKELAHEQTVSELRAQLAAAEGHEQAVDSKSVDDYRSGADHLRLPVRTCSAAVASAVESTAAGTDAETIAELAPETAATLYSIAADGDAAIRQLDGLQTWAEAAVKLCSVPPVK